jgi:hypothetical protein
VPLLEFEPAEGVLRVKKKGTILKNCDVMLYRTNTELVYEYAPVSSQSQSHLDIATKHFFGRIIVLYPNICVGVYRYFNPDYNVSQA